MNSATKVLRLLAATLSLLVVSALAPVSSPVGPSSAEAAVGTRSTVNIVVGGVTRSYNMFVPASVDPSRPSRLVLMLHGLYQTPAAAETFSDWNTVAAEGRFVVVYPNGNGSWNAGTCCGAAVGQNRNDVAYLDAVIAHVKATRKVDAARVYMAGFSTGGMMTLRYSCERAKTIAGIAVGSGTLVTKSPCVPARPVPMVFFHGAKDSTVPYKGTAWSSFLKTKLRSVPSTTAAFAKVAGCGRLVTSRPNAKVYAYTYACPPGRHVRTYLSAPMGHTWTRDVNAHGMNQTRTAWSFLWPQHL